jgi:hypothetical protein
LDDFLMRYRRIVFGLFDSESVTVVRIRRTSERGGCFWDFEKGISLGCPLSPLIGAFFLSAVDDALDKTGLFYIRFMDDILVLAPSRWKLHHAVRTVNQALAMEDTIGIDISKDNLDAYWLSKGEHKQFGNDKAGVEALALWAKKARVSRVIFESTGIYHRRVETGLADYCISFARVNPRQARRFCKGAGQLAKTDRVDAAMLAKMGSQLQLKADQPNSETLHDLNWLATARQALIKDRTAAKARLAATTHRLLSLDLWGHWFLQSDYP